MLHEVENSIYVVNYSGRIIFSADAAKIYFAIKKTWSRVLAVIKSSTMRFDKEHRLPSQLITTCFLFFFTSLAQNCSDQVVDMKAGSSYNLDIPFNGCYLAVMQYAGGDHKEININPSTCSGSTPKYLLDISSTTPPGNLTLTIFCIDVAAPHCYDFKILPPNASTSSSTSHDQIQASCSSLPPYPMSSYQGSMAGTAMPSSGAAGQMPELKTTGMNAPASSASPPSAEPTDSLDSQNTKTNIDPAPSSASNPTGPQSLQSSPNGPAYSSLAEPSDPSGSMEQSSGADSSTLPPSSSDPNGQPQWTNSSPEMNMPSDNPTALPQSGSSANDSLSNVSTCLCTPTSTI